MAAYYTAQAYDAPASFIWSVLTDFDTWPEWFPQVSALRLEDAALAAKGTRLVALGADPNVWTRWEIAEWRAPALLLCEHIESSSPAAPHVQAAYLQFELLDEPEGCTLEVEIGAEGYGLIGDFFIGVTLGNEVRRLLPQLVDSFTEHVVRSAARR